MKPRNDRSGGRKAPVLPHSVTMVYTEAQETVNMLAIDTLKLAEDLKEGGPLFFTVGVPGC